jgi:hypothetical protein
MNVPFCWSLDIVTTLNQNTPVRKNQRDEDHMENRKYAIINGLLPNTESMD